MPVWTNTLESRLLFSNASLTNCTGRLHSSQFLGRSVKCNLHLFCASAERRLCLRNSAQENNAKRSVHLFDKGFLFHKMFLVKCKESERTKSLFTFQFSSLLCFQGGTGSHSALGKLKPRKYFHWSRVKPCTENLPLFCCMNGEMIFGSYNLSVFCSKLSHYSLTDNKVNAM